jgi:hypothetical protein
LFGTHIERRADHLQKVGIEGLFGELLVDRLGDAKVDHFRDSYAVNFWHEHVGRFEIAVNDAFLVGVVNGSADFRKQLQPLPCVEPLRIAVLGDRRALHQLHHEIRLPRLRSTAVQDTSDVGVVHDR